MVINFDFRSGAKKSGHLDYPFQSYGPKVITPPKKRRNKKITRLQFCVPSFHIESASPKYVCFEADSMAEPETQNCSRGIFLTTLVFANIAKISDSVDFEQP